MTASSLYLLVRCCAKICNACRVLAAAKTVSHNGDMLKPAFVLAAVMAEIAAADTAAFLVDL